MMKLSAILLAAGSSHRMGTPKALLRHACGSTFARYLLNCYGLYGCNPIVLVMGEAPELHAYRHGPHIHVVNQHPEKGRSHSIHLGLQQIADRSACFVQNIDNPYLSPELLDELVQQMAPDRFVVPVFQAKGGHPILLGSDIVEFLKKNHPSGDFRDALKGFTRVEVPFNERQILLNLNTPEEYRAYLRPGMEKNL